VNQEQSDALAAMIEAVECGMALCSWDEFDRRSLGRVLEELRLLRDEGAVIPPSKPLPHDWAQILQTVRTDSGLGLKEAKAICERVGWDRDRAMTLASEAKEIKQ
jgi:hypothetical protein